MSRIMRPPGMAVRKAAVGPQEELGHRVVSCCLWVVLRLKWDRKPALQEPSPFLATSCCALSSPFLLLINSSGLPRVSQLSPSVPRAVAVRMTLGSVVRCCPVMPPARQAVLACLAT